MKGNFYGNAFKQRNRTTLDSKMKGIQEGLSMKEKNRVFRIEYLLMLITCFFWALGHPLGRIILRELHPFQLGSITLTSGFCIILIYMLVAGRIRELFSIKRKDLLLSMGLGIFGFFLYQILTFSALSRIPASMNAVIISTNVVWIALLAAAILKERIPLPRFGAIVLALAGAVFVTFNMGFSLNQEITLTGCSFSLLAAISFAIYTVFGKKLLSDNEPLTVALLGIFSGALFLSLLTWRTVGFPARGTTATSTLILTILLGITMIGLSYPLWFTCLKNLPASHVSIYIYMTPIFAVILSLIILKERFSWRFGLGTALVLGGIVLTNLLGGMKREDKIKY